MCQQARRGSSPSFQRHWEGCTPGGRHFDSPLSFRPLCPHCQAICFSRNWTVRPQRPRPVLLCRLSLTHGKAICTSAITGVVTGRVGEGDLVRLLMGSKASWCSRQEGPIRRKDALPCPPCALWNSQCLPGDQPLAKGPEAPGVIAASTVTHAKCNDHGLQVSEL